MKKEEKGVFKPRTIDEGMITKEENKAELIKMLDDIDDALQKKQIAFKDAMSLKRDIRVKLNDKFEMEESTKEKRIIIVPQKHDYVCPHTNRECSKMPSKEACMEYYGLIEKK